MDSYLYLNAPIPNASAVLDVGGTSAATYYSYLNGLRLSGRDISIYTYSKCWNYHSRGF